MIEPGERRLDDADQAAIEREQADDDLGRIAQSRVQQGPQGRPEILGQGLGRIAHQAGKRHDRQRRRREHHDRVEVQNQSTAIATGMKTSSQFSFKEMPALSWTKRDARLDFPTPSSRRFPARSFHSMGANQVGHSIAVKIGDCINVGLRRTAIQSTQSRHPFCTRIGQVN